MKFFNWMQNKFNGGGGGGQMGTAKMPNATPSSSPPPPASSSDHGRLRENPKEEKDNWSHGLLTIGTMGNQQVPPEENEDRRPPPPPPSEENIEPDEILEAVEKTTSFIHQDLAEFTPEEVVQLQKELKKLLKKKQKTHQVENNNNNNLPLDRFLNCPSSLTVDRSGSSRYSTISGGSNIIEEDNIDRTIRVIIERCKQASLENKKKGIGKKSISFLFKKMFVCSSGFAPAPAPAPTPFRDTLQESRMEKLLRTMLSKKMYPQNASRASSTKRILEGRYSMKKDTIDDDEAQHRKNDACKWVKTDSEYIVLDLD